MNVRSSSAAAALFCCTMLMADGGGHLARAQCRDLEAQPGDAGYKPRGERCEGMYVGRQSAPINIQVVSLVKGGLDVPQAIDEVRIHVPRALADIDSLSHDVSIVGDTREANLHWALDSTEPLRPGQAISWDLEVLRRVRLESKRLGLYGRTTHESGLGGPIFVPVAVTAPGASVPADAPIELVFRIPAAARACLFDTSNGGCSQRASPLNADGYFRIVIPPGEPGPTTLAFRWYPSGSPTSNQTPETLTIYRW